MKKSNIQLWQTLPYVMFVEQNRFLFQKYNLVVYDSDDTYSISPMYSLPSLPCPCGDRDVFGPQSREDVSLALKGP